MATDAQTAVLAMVQRRSADSTARMAEIDVPTLVLHSVGDQAQGFHHSRKLAAGIRGARLVPLPSDNHIVLADEPAWPVFLREVGEFLASDRTTPPPAVERVEVTSVLSSREVDVLRLAARGWDNEEIAGELFLSVRTVERHLQNAYAKLGLQGRAARTAAVAMLLSGA
jgi:DNA-binding NarL/FixJ family response regulator